MELEGELRVEETITRVRALTLKNTLLSGDVAVTIGGKVKIRQAHIFFLAPRFRKKVSWRIALFA